MPASSAPPTIAVVTVLLARDEVGTPVAHVLWWPDAVRTDPLWAEEHFVVVEEKPGDIRARNVTIALRVTRDHGQPSAAWEWVEQRVASDDGFGPDLAAWIDHGHRQMLAKTDFGHRVEMTPSPDVTGRPPIWFYAPVLLRLLQQWPAPLPQAIRVHPLGQAAWTHTARIRVLE